MDSFWNGQSTGFRRPYLNVAGLSLAFTSAPSSTSASYPATIEGTAGLTVELFLGGVSQGNMTESPSGTYSKSVTLDSLSNNLVAKVNGVEYDALTVTWLRYGLTQWIDFRTDNLLQHSENLTNAAWMFGQTSVTLNPPETISGATRTVHKLVSTTPGNNPQMYQLLSIDPKPYSWSLGMWIKGEGASIGKQCHIRLADHSFNETSNAVATITGAWQFVKIEGKTFSTSTTLRAGAEWVNTSPATGDILYVSEPQLCNNATLLPYVATNALQNRSDWAVFGSTVTLGSSSSVATDDPALDGYSAVFDGVNDLLSNLASLGGTWAIFQSNETALQYVDSAGTQKVYSGGSESAGSVTAFAVGTAGGYTGKLEQREVWSVIPTDAQRLQAFADMASRASAKGISY